MPFFHDDIPGWDGTTGGASALRQALAVQVQLRDGFPKSLSTVAGFRFSGDVDNLHATVVLLDAARFSVIESHVACIAVSASHETGQRAFREVAALLAVFRTLSTIPDVALVEGHGIAHPQRFGVASHFGVATGIPTIGVAMAMLVGTASPLHQIRGAYTPLRDHGQQVGWLLRTQGQQEPLVVSPGHKVAMASAADLVMRFVTCHRLPEPLRMAGQMLSDSDATHAPAKSE